MMNLHVESMCAHLWGDRAENAGSSSDEVSNEQGEARQAEEEETRRTGTDDGVQHILMTHTHTNMLIGNKQQFPHWYHYPSITALTWYRNKQLFSIRTKTEYLSQYVHSQMGFLDLEWARGLISVDGGKQKYFVNGPPHERHGRVKAFSSNR